jgi:hypothetical protein
MLVHYYQVHDLLGLIICFLNATMEPVHDYSVANLLVM